MVDKRPSQHSACAGHGRGCRHRRGTVLFVLAVAGAGVLLALLTAFAPWYAVPVEPRGDVVVEMRPPAGSVPAFGVTADEVGLTTAGSG